jgi:endonuclease YncB( thermonuclease family)
MHRLGGFLLQAQRQIGIDLNGIAIMTCLSLSAIDGDTARCDGESLRPMGPGAPYESGFDAPEVGHRADCRAERRAGEAATRRMAELLATPGLAVVDSGEVDRWGRRLVWLMLPSGQTIGEVMISEGHAVEWRPGHQANWCG